MLGERTLLVNPPLVGGIAFTRQGRCQEREEVLGTTKPPYSLALIAALLRNRPGYSVRLADLTATHESTPQLMARLDAEGFRPTLIVFPSTTPTLDADVAQMARLKHAYRAPLVDVRPARVGHAGRGDGTGAGGGRDDRRRARRRAARHRGARVARGPGRRSLRHVPPRRTGRPAPRPRAVRGISHSTVPGVGPARPHPLSAPAGRSTVRDRRGIARMPVFVRLLRRADPSGPQVSREEREGAGGRDRAWLSHVRAHVLLPLGRYRHAQREDVQRDLRGADRAEAADPVAWQRARGQPGRSGIREAAPPGGLLDARARHRNRVRGNPQGHDEAARGPEDPDGHPQHAGGGHQLVRLLHLRVSGRDAGGARADDRLRGRSRSRLRQFLSGRAVPRHRAAREGQARGPAGQRGLDAHGVPGTTCCAAMASTRTS